MTSSGDILPFTMLRMPTSGCYSLSTRFIDSSSLFLGFPQSFASDNMRDIISSLWRFLVDISWWVISRMSFFIRQQMCRLKSHVWFDLVLSVMPIRWRGLLPYHLKVVSIIWHHVLSTSRSTLRQYGESQVLLEESAYIFRLALLRMIKCNTYNNRHSYRAMLRRNMGSWDSLHVDVMASLLPFQVGRISSWERLVL